MAISSCCSGLAVTVALALLFLPTQYYVPELYSEVDDLLADIEQFDGPPAEEPWFNFGFHISPVDYVVSLILLILYLFIHFCEWIQMKIMERRIVKLNQYLGVSLERLRSWDAQQEQLEVTLKIVQNATSEYNLLLYLLLRQHRCLPGTPKSSKKSKKS